MPKGKPTLSVTTPAPAREWPADSVEKWPIERLIPYAKNARTHSDAQVAQIAASMKEWGWTNPVLADETGGLISGHGRILAARQLGIEEVPVMMARGWTEAQKRAYVIADNKLSLNASWDDELLRLELGELKLSGFDLSLTGFDDLELKGLDGERDAEIDAASKLHEGLSYQIIVECDDEFQQTEMLEDFRAREIRCRPLIL